MNKVYISLQSLNDAVSYFKDTDYNSPEQVGLFFFFKAVKFNNREYVKFSKAGSLTLEQKRKYLRYIYNLAGLFNAGNENGEKRNSLFPFSITDEVKSSNYYNGGTVFKGLVSRVTDTMDNTLVDENKYLRRDELDAESYKFPPNYINMLFTEFLKNNPISLGRFAAWYFRFHEFEVNEEWITNPTEEHYRKFTHVCTKKLISDLNLNKEELAVLFIQDDFIIRYQTDSVSGQDLRNLITFKSDALPEVTTTGASVDYMQVEVKMPLDEFNDLVTPRGRNISTDKLETLLLSTKQIVLTGPPGTGKSHISSKIKSRFDESFLIQFHPNLTYEQFIGGNTFDESGNVSAAAGIFVEFCEKARQDSNHNYLFVIDEINRGNISKIFGEVILTLDREYESQLPIRLKLKDGSLVEKFSIPKNVYILATMNSADRSIAIVDYAIRRRFGFITFFPNSEVVDYLSDYKNLSIMKVSSLMDRLNDKLFSVLNDADLLLGQSYFMPKWAINPTTGKIQWTDEILQTLFNYYILPIIEEYTYGNRRYLLNIVGDKLADRIIDTETFCEELMNQFR